MPEIGRVLRFGGALGLIWNVRDESIDWVARLTGIVGSENSAESRSGLVCRPGFGEFETKITSWTQPMDRKTLLAHVRSRSAVATMDESERRRVLAEVAALCDAHPDLRDKQRFELPYQTHAYRARHTG